MRKRLYWVETPLGGGPGFYKKAEQAVSDTLHGLSSSSHLQGPALLGFLPSQFLMVWYYVELGEINPFLPKLRLVTFHHSRRTLRQTHYFMWLSLDVVGVVGQAHL